MKSVLDSKSPAVFSPLLDGKLRGNHALALLFLFDRTMINTAKSAKRYIQDQIKSNYIYSQC